MIIEGKHSVVARVSKSTQTIQYENEVQCWQLPTWNRNFIERFHALKSVEKLLAEDIRLAITGMGGVGKTSLAIAYSYLAKEHKCYEKIIWLDGTKNLFNELQSYISETLNIKAYNLTQAQLLVVLEEHLNSSKVLFSIDNVENNEIEDEIFKIISNKYSILITTRSQLFKKFKTYSLDVFSESESIYYISKYLGEQQIENSVKLAKLVSYYPLALSQALSFIKIKKLSIEDYLKNYEFKKTLCLVPENFDDNHAPVHITYDVILNQIKKQASSNKKLTKQVASTALDILNDIAYLAPERIPLFVFGCEQNNKIFLSALELLMSYSLIGYTGEFISIHRVVQAIIQRKIGDLSLAYNQINKMMDRINNILNARYISNPFYIENNNQDFFILKCYQTFIPHMQVLADNYKNIAMSNGIVSDDVASIFFKYLGMLLNYLAKYELAEVAMIQSLQLSSKAGEFNKIDSLFNLAVINSNLGRQADAIKFLDTIYSRLTADKLLLKTKVLHEWGQFYKRQGNYSKALVKLQEALTLIKKLEQTTLEKNQKDYNPVLSLKADIFLSLGQVYLYQAEYSKNKYEGAKKCFEQSLQLKHEIYGKISNIPIAETLHEMGDILQGLGLYNQAKDQFIEVLDMKKTIYGTEYHSSVADTFHALAYAYYNLKEYDNALDCAEKTLKIKRLTFGDVANTHPELGAVYKAKGKIHLARKEYAQAKECLLQACRIKENSLQENLNYKSLSDCYFALGDYYKAMNEIDILSYYRELANLLLEVAHSVFNDFKVSLDQINLIKTKYDALSKYYYSLLENINLIEMKSLHRTLAKQYDRLSEFIFKQFNTGTVHAGQAGSNSMIVVNGVYIALTSREMEVIKNLCKGFSAKVTASKLNITVKTVENYLANIRYKTKCRSKLELLSKITFLN